MARDKNKGQDTPVVVAEEKPANIIRNEKGCAKRHARKAALLKMLEYVKKQEDHNLTEEIILLTPGQHDGGGGKSRLDNFSDLFTTNAEVSGLTIYQELGAGQGEMRTIVRNLIKTKKPVDRIWVHYDKASDTYTVMGVGEEAPEGWTGYRPVEVDDVEII